MPLVTEIQEKLAAFRRMSPKPPTRLYVGVDNYADLRLWANSYAYCKVEPTNEYDLPKEVFMGMEIFVVASHPRHLHIC